MSEGLERTHRTGVVTEEAPVREAPITVLSARPGGACHHVALLTEEVAVTTIAQSQDRRVIGGVDTHKDVHVAAVIDDLGRIQGTQSFPTTRHGYRRLLGWLQSHVPVDDLRIWRVATEVPIPGQARPAACAETRAPGKSSFQWVDA